MEIEGESSLGRDSLQAGKRERRKKIENIYYTVPRAKRGENERSSIQRSCSPTSLTFSPLRFLSFLPFPKFFRVKSFFSLFHRFRHAIEVTRVSSLGKKLTVAPFTQNCRHSNGEAIHRCAGGRCFPSYDSTRYQPPTYSVYIYIYTLVHSCSSRTRVYTHSCIYHLVWQSILGRAEVAANWSKTGLPSVRVSSSPGEIFGAYWSRSIFLPPLATLCHTRSRPTCFPSSLFQLTRKTTVCDPLVICATSASYFDVGARGFADARHRKSSPLTMQDRGSKSQRHSEMRRREVG